MNNVEITAVELVIGNEIKQGLTQWQIAQTYALALPSTWPTDWKKSQCDDHRTMEPDGPEQH